jgi:hypothetical protein
MYYSEIAYSRQALKIKIAMALNFIFVLVMGVFIRCRRCGTFQVLHDSTGVHSHVILLLGDWRGGLELRPNHFVCF